MEELSEEAKQSAIEDDKRWRRSQGMYVAGDEQNQSNGGGGIGWFNQMAVLVVGVCVIGIVIQSFQGKRPKDPIPTPTPVITPGRGGLTQEEQQTDPSNSSASEILPFAPKGNPTRGAENSAIAKTNPVRPQPRRNETPSFNGTGRLASFPRSMTIDCLQTNHDGTKLYAGVNEAVIEYDLQTGKQLREFIGHDGEITSLDIFDEGRKLITGSNDKYAIIWDLDTGRQRHRLPESNTVSAVAGSRDGKLVATAALSKNPQIWSVEKGQPLGRTKIESWPWNSKINALSFDDKAKYLIGGGTSYNSHIWTVSSGRQKGQIQAHKNQYVLDLALSPNGDSLVMLDATGVKVFETKRYQEQLSLDFDAPKRMQALVTNDGNRFIAVNGVYGLKEGNRISQTDIPLSTCRTLTATPDGSRFIFATSRKIEVVAGE